MTQATGETLTTIVFVDVEGSTGLVDRLGDAAGTRAVLRQLDVVRERLPSYGGHEVKSLGDGLLLTFGSPRQAVAFGVACQRALGDSAPRMRIGVNTGEVIDLDDDPIGGAVNAAARIADRADGGEVLVSDVVRQLAGATPSCASWTEGACASRASPSRGSCGRPSTGRPRPTGSRRSVDASSSP